MATLEKGVERKADVVCLQELPQEPAGSEISYAAYSIRQWRRGWTSVRKRSSLTTNKRTDLSKNAGDDEIVVHIQARREKNHKDR